MSIAYSSVNNHSADVQENTFNDESFSTSSLVSRNICIFRKRTSIRLEPEMWQALSDIARREGCSIHDICTVVSLRKPSSTSLTAAIRVFLMLYFRAAATEDGHRNAGHGSFQSMIKRARIDHQLGQTRKSDTSLQAGRVMPIHKLNHTGDVAGQA